MIDIQEIAMRHRELIGSYPYEHVVHDWPVIQKKVDAAVALERAAALLAAKAEVKQLS